MNPERMNSGEQQGQRNEESLRRAGERALAGVETKSEKMTPEELEAFSLDRMERLAAELDSYGAGTQTKETVEALVHLPGLPEEDKKKLVDGYANGSSLIDFVKNVKQVYLERKRQAETAQPQPEAEVQDEKAPEQPQAADFEGMDTGVIETRSEDAPFMNAMNNRLREIDAEQGVNPVLARSTEEELADVMLSNMEADEATREGWINKVKARLGGKRLARVAALLLTGVVVVGAVAGVASLFSGEEAEASTPTGPEKKAEATTNQPAPELEDETPAEVESLLDNEALYKGDIDVSQFDLLALGNEQYKDFTEANYPNMQKDEFSGVVADYVSSGYTNYENKASKNAISDKRLESTREALENGNINPTRDMVLETIKANPQELASTMSMLPPLLEQLGLGEIAEMKNAGERAQKLSEMMVSSENGSDLQKQWYEAVEIAMKNESTKWGSEEMSGYGTSTFIKQIDDELGEKIANLTPGVSKVERADGDWHIKVEMPFKVVNEDGTESVVTVVLYIRGICDNKDSLNSYSKKEDGEPVPISEQEQEELEQIKEDEKNEGKPASTQPKTEQVTGTPEKQPEEVTQTEEKVLESKDAADLVQSQADALANAGSVNYAQQAQKVDNPPQSTGDGQIIENDDGSKTIINNSGVVSSVTDGETGETIEVNPGTVTTPVNQETVGTGEEGKVTEGLTYSDDASAQTNNEDDEADALMSIVNSTPEQG